MTETKQPDRPINCGTGYCSCIECPYEQAQPEPSTHKDARIEALEAEVEADNRNLEQLSDEVNALRKQLAAAQGHEPICWYKESNGDTIPHHAMEQSRKDSGVWKPLYAAQQAQPERAPLSEDEIFKALDADIAAVEDAKADAESWETIVNMVRAIEAAHGIKQGGAVEQAQPEQAQPKKPIAYFDFQERGFYWAPNIAIGPVPVARKVEPMPLYSSQQAQPERDALEARLAAAQAQCEQQRGYKDGAYLERNRLVALLSKVFPSGKKKTAIEGWSEDWHCCVYIDLPTGQASWHYHDSQAWLFEHLPEYQGTWDGHTTNEKYDRIQGYSAPAQQAQPERAPLTDSELETMWASENGLEDCQLCKRDDFIKAAKYFYLKQGGAA